jgi:fungal STAND N-terminal Goodbye domain
MSSTGQATSPFENVILIINALADYAEETGVDLSKNTFAAKLEQLRSPEDILQLLEEREKAFTEYREGNRKLSNLLNPTVRVLHGFSGILSEAAGLVSRKCHLVGLLM